MRTSHAEILETPPEMNLQALLCRQRVAIAECRVPKSLKARQYRLSTLE